MKTSSKLLIILAVLLFVVPVSIMSFTVKSNRIDVVDYRRDMDREASTLAGQDVYLETTPLKAFHKVSLKGGGSLGPIALIVVKSDKYALKVEKNNTGKLKFAVDDSGVLLIEGEEMPHHYFNTVYIFTPNLHHLDLQNVDLQAKIETDSLTVDGHDLSGFHLLSGTAINNLHVIAKHSNIEMNANNGQGDLDYSVQNLSFDVDSSHVSLDQQAWKRLAFQAKGSKITVAQKGESWPLDELQLTTVGVNNIRLDSLQAKKISGRLSDETIIDLPISQLRQLIGSK